MLQVNGFLSTVPFDLYELGLFDLVVKQKSFTRAAALAGLTQSAITRQVQGMEKALGVELLKRTTRTLALTPAGEFLWREAGRLLADAESSLRALQQEFGNAPREIRLAVSRSVGLAYLPGFFHANLRKVKNVTYRFQYGRTPDILLALESGEQDVGVVSASRRLPPTLEVTHRFEDIFALIAPAMASTQYRSFNSNVMRREWLNAQQWFLFDEASNTGRQVSAWLRREGIRPVKNSQFDSYDLIINLVSLGMGVALVPARALALYPQKKSIARLPSSRMFSRELIVVVRARRSLPSQVNEFISNILF